MEYCYSGTESLWYGSWNRHVCRKGKFAADRHSRSTGVNPSRKQRCCSLSCLWSQPQRDTHVQNQSPISTGRKVMAKVKVFQKYVKLQGQGQEVKNYGTMWKVLSQEIHVCNLEALSLPVRKLWPRLKFFKSRSNFKVKVTRSKIMVPCEKSCHKEYTCAIWKPHLL